MRKYIVYVITDMLLYVKVLRYNNFSQVIKMLSYKK